jgi:hypothetical protein
MSLAQTATEFLSRKVRINTAAGRIGRAVILPPVNISKNLSLVRKIGNLTKLQKKVDGDGGVLGFLWDKGKNLLGWIGSKALKFLSFSATSIFSWLVGAVEKLKAFDWNASDKALEKAMENSNVAIASIWGSFVGQGLGWLAGIAVGYGVSFLCPVIGGAGLARLIALKTSKEALEELSSGLAGAIKQTAGILGSNLATIGYMNFRRLLKNAPRGVLEAVYGKDGADFIQKVWGKEGGPNMSFNTQMEQAVEGISNKAVQAFVENALEEGWDSFMEAGFIVAAEIDEAYAQQKHAANQSLGTQRSLEIELDTTAPTESKEVLQVVKMPQRLMVQSVQQSINTYRMIHNRDVGLVMGLPVEEYTRAKPQSLRVTIDLYSVKHPPFFRNTQDLTWATVTIPDVKRSALEWTTIKTAVGGANGYLWGRFRAVAYLDTGRKIICHAGTEEEAEERIKALLRLTTAELTTLNITEEKKAGERLTKRKLQKETKRVYPAYFTVINRQELLDPTEGRASTRQKNYRDAKARIPLWLDKEPANADARIREVLKKGV